MDPLQFTYDQVYQILFDGRATAKNGLTIYNLESDQKPIKLYKYLKFKNSIILINLFTIINMKHILIDQTKTISRVCINMFINLLGTTLMPLVNTKTEHIIIISRVELYIHYVYLFNKQ